MITGRSHNHAGGQRSAVSRLPCHAGLPHSLVVARKRVITRVATSPRHVSRGPEERRPDGQDSLRRGVLDSDVHQEYSHGSFTPITSMWAHNAAQHGQLVAVQDPHRGSGVSFTYAQLNEAILDYAAGLRASGLQRGDTVALFAEASSRWIVADQGILMNGAADAVRGSSSPTEELLYILAHSGSAGLILQDGAALTRLAPALLAESAAAADGAAAGAAAGNEQQQQRPRLQRPLKFVVLLWDDAPTAAAGSDADAAPPHAEAVRALRSAGIRVMSHADVTAAGAALRSVGPFAPADVSRSDTATLVYTSGTTGHPKAVALSHGNLAYQVAQLGYFLQVSPGDSTLSLLPPWHIYQRSVGYYLFSRGAREVQSSLRSLRDDLASYPPDHFVCVPLVLDSLHAKVSAKLRAEATGLRGVIVSALLAASLAHTSARRVLAGVDVRYARLPPGPLELLWAGLLAVATAAGHALARTLIWSKVRAALGVRRTVVSGGGSLSGHLDLWYEALGLPVLNGWGLTETSPVLACRRSVDNVRGSVGVPTPGTRLLVVDPDTHAPLPDGQQGLILAAGPGVMAGGYAGDAAATAGAFVDGWFNTGDLGWRAPAGVPGSKMAGHVVLTGRAKDTIVLLSGKNVEPQPIEDALTQSPLIKHALVLGQDKRELGVLVFPDQEAVAAAGLDEAPASALQAALATVVAELNGARPDYVPHEHVAALQVVHAPLSIEAGTLTRTMKPRRAAIQKSYDADVAALLARLR